MGKLNPQNAENWSLINEYKVYGHQIELRSGGYLHIASFVDGELIAQDHDNRGYVKQEAERHAKYKSEEE